MTEQTFSVRTRWDRSLNPLAERLAARRAIGESILDLTESNPTRAGFAYPERAILEALAAPEAMRYAPDPRGLRSAREAVARWYARRGRLVSPDRIILCASTSEAYAWLFKLLCEDGDEVLAPAPSYPLFDFLARAEDVQLGSYPLEYEGRWALHVEDLAARCGERTRGVIIVQPNNPTGSVLSPLEMERLGAHCASEGLAIISDEVFSDYAFENVPGAMPSAVDLDGPLTFTLGGLSKAAGLPQMKLSWIVAGGPDALREEALARLEILGDTFLSVNTPVQAGLDRILEAGEEVSRQIKERVAGNRALLRLARDSDAAWDVLVADGGWYAVVSLPRVMTDEDWAVTLLDRDGVYVHPGHYFDFAADGFLVVSLLPRREEFAEGVRRIAARVKEVVG
jgi:alanine-synthesizing transaminase